MRIATYNVEWFANLFDKNNHLIFDENWSGRHNVRRDQQIEALAKVFTIIDADAIMIVEAPNTGRSQSSGAALENFAKAFDLRTKATLEGFANDTHQEITLMYDPYVVSARHDPLGPTDDNHEIISAPRFDTALRIDGDLDTVHENITFSKPPLEVELLHGDAPPIRLIGVHIKSKVPHGAKSLKEQLRLSIDNRRKQLAQCVWLRRRVEEHLDQKEPLIVLGDFNDGPGLDEYEHLFGHSGVEIVLGCGGEESRMLYDPSAMEAMSPRASTRPATSRFFIPDRNTYLNALLDFIMVSPDLRPKANRWEIWHPFDNPKCCGDPELRDALLTASDHFPVTLDLSF